MFRSFSTTIIFLFLPFIVEASQNLISDSFNVSNMEVHHQGINHLDINIKYTYKSTADFAKDPDSKIMARDLDSMLVLYPNTTDWWEIVNKNITSIFMNKYPGIDSLSSDILVHWTSGAGVEYGHRYPTRCITARTRKGGLYEFFGFLTPMDSLFECFMGHKLYKIFIDLSYQYIQPIYNKDYPDGLATENDFRKLICVNLETQKYWQDIIDETQKQMIAKYPELQNLASEIIFYDVAGEQFEARTVTKR